MADYNSGWIDFASGRFSPSMLASRCREIIEAMERRGIRPPASNRITRAMRHVERLNKPGVLAAASSEDLHLGSEAFRTLWEFFFIGYTWRERGRSGGPLTSERLYVLFEGADTAGADANSRPRNIQFELYLASAMILGGADVLDGNPDIRFLYHGAYRGVAIKRVHTLSKNAVRKAVRDAVRQIRGSTQTGFVALNLDEWISGLETRSDASALGASFNAAVEDAHNALADMSDREALLGALLYGTWFGWAHDGPIPRIEFHMPRQTCCFTTTDADVARARQFFEPIRERLGNALAEACKLVGPPQSD